MALVAMLRILADTLLLWNNLYKEIGLHDVVLAAQVETRTNLIKNNSSKRVHFSDDADHSGQKYVDDLSDHKRSSHTIIYPSSYQSSMMLNITLRC